ncbi:hypothetical protein AB1Y20_017143 [Prymnesium parvum]|uniref:Ubiquitin carboxyl-terminal hydrolase n=1 Tax=Prymnesium parvum TaxID=97485 RepID=A0AB34IBK3_PRYPA
MAAASAADASADGVIPLEAVFTGHPPRGLVNMGNSCYLNAALQALAHCPALSYYFCSCEPLYSLPPGHAHGDSAELIGAFSQLVLQLRGLSAADASSALKPFRLMKCARVLLPHFELHAQQDAQELLRALLDGIHEALKRPLSDDELYDYRERLSAQWRECTGLEWRDEAQAAYEAQLEAKAKEAKTLAHPHRPPPPPPRPTTSPIAQLFEGQLLSAVKCLNCERISYTRDSFLDLSLSMPSPRKQRRDPGRAGDPSRPTPVTSVDEENGGRLPGGRQTKERKPRLGFWRLLHPAKTNERPVGITDALSAFFGVEELTGDEKYNCEHCDARHNGQKHLAIFKPPNVLAIHLKRFRFAGTARKASDHVSFPLTGDRLRPTHCTLSILSFPAPPPHTPFPPTTHAPPPLPPLPLLFPSSSPPLPLLFPSSSPPLPLLFPSSSPPLPLSPPPLCRSPRALAFSLCAGLNLKPYCAKSVESSAEYDLCAVVTHHGAALSSGHYTAYVCSHAEPKEPKWYHVDDSRVQEVPAERVLHTEAYMLFYTRRMHAGHKAFAARTAMTINRSLAEGRGELLLSRGWLARFLTTDEPGAVAHSDVLCAHAAVDVGRTSLERAALACVRVPRGTWDELVGKYLQAAPEAAAVPQLQSCAVCLELHQQEMAALQEERDEISSLDSTEIQPGELWYLLDAEWLKHWREYCWDSTRVDPPGPVSNWRLLRDGRPRPNQMRARDYRGVNQRVWAVFMRRYGGGPAICRKELNLYAQAVEPSQHPAHDRNTEL